MMSSLSRRRKHQPLLRLASRVGALLREPFPSKRLTAACGFTAELLRHPLSIGAICPSGRQLARGMASLIPTERSGLIIEIGAGTGAVTSAILQRGIHPDRMLVLERSPSFCQTLQQKFPTLNIVQGDAAKLASYIPAGTQVDAVVSSLPLMSLPRQVRENILEQIRKVLAPGGCVIQFTYALWSTSPFRRDGYTRDVKNIIIRNVPPARLERFFYPRREG